MMSEGIKQPKEDHTPTVTFRADEKSKVELDLTGIELEDVITATVKGKISSLSEDEYGSSVGMKISSIAFKKDGKSSIIDALKKIKKGS